MIITFKEVKMFTAFAMFNQKRPLIKVTMTTARDVSNGEIINIDMNEKVIIY